MEVYTLDEKSTDVKKTIIIFDGHGLTNKKDVYLSYNHYFLCNEGETIDFGTFGKMVKQLVADKGLTDLSDLPNNFEYQKEHALFELKDYQKLSSYTCNLRKAVSLRPNIGYEVKEIATSLKYQDVSYNFKIQFTNFHPETNHRLVFVRTEDKQYVKLSALEKLIFPLFVDNNDPVMESCGMALEKFEGEAIGLWGACREINESIE